MAAPQSTQDQTTYEFPSIGGASEQVPEYVILIASAVAVGTLGTILVAVGILAVLVVTPTITSVAGTGGLLLVWAGGIAYVVSIPEIVRRCLVAITHTR